jgi:hypothetical protein
MLVFSNVDKQLLGDLVCLFGAESARVSRETASGLYA